ncbi:amino acid adenylation domain-containing protein [Amycolatopsis sulphurea]|uniref:Amino acid adenylation domain-containing protein n=1 Tax=Amycolatopsis sulphurea TaxID=76022 RepID=A0A2A9G2K8_9PSEU|nr:amino acid adenylation domain-containing protein [Amycolatopsis sulphurea]PFG57040.1 amino acid adenylation domain-containing protein [Amycolatopsis sulphurea]
MNQLTPIQAQLLSASQLAMEVNVETIRLGLWLPASTDIDLMAQAWRRTFTRHRALTVRFVPGIDGWHYEPDNEPVRLTYHPPTAWTADEFFTRAIARDAEEPLDLGRTPMRLSWAPDEDGSGVWIWTFHHALVDNFSIQLVTVQALEAYARMRRGDGLDPVPLTDFFTASGQLRAQEDEDATQFWAARLATGSTTGPRGDRSQVRWTQARSAPHVPGRDRDEPTESTFLIAALALLTAEQTSQNDVTVGNVYSFRRVLPQEWQDVVGPLMHVVPLKIVVDRRAGVVDFLRYIRKIDLDSRSYAVSPSAAGMASTSGFSAALNYQPRNWRAQITEALCAAVGAQNKDDLVRINRRSGLPLVLDANEDDELGLTLDSWSAVHSNVRLTDFAGRLQLLSSRLRSGADRVDQVLRLPEPARDRVLALGTGPKLVVTAQSAIAVFAEAVARHPDADAVAGAGKTLTYGALNRSANRLAHHLRTRGVMRGHRIGICLERTNELCVAVLAILKLGAAYVPLDPGYPAPRVRYTVEDAQCTLIVSALSHSAMFGEIPVVILDDESAREAIAACDETEVEVEVDPHDPAYVIYTSGSTGTPKGVVVPHRGIANLAATQSVLFGLDRSDRVLQFASAAFDASVSELFVTWGANACVVLIRDSDRTGIALQECIVNERVTMATLPPSVLSTLDQNKVPGLSTVITAGEPCSRGVVEAWGGSRRLINAYGPTEATVCVSGVRLRPGDAVTIGPPLGNVRIYVLADGEPVPVGAPGELCVAGPGVALGYLGHAELTAQRFVPDPFSGGTMYRTGDLVRMRADGGLVFLGRNDDQVKVRGFRIEPAEVENVLRSHDSVGQAVVAVRGTGEHARLVGYLDRPVPEDMRAWLAGRIPSHLVPSTFVEVSQFPLSPNGKIDRRALPDPAPLPTTAYVAPRSELELAIAEAWAQVLRVKRVGVHDSFFDLGGSSLQAARIVSACNWLGEVASPLLQDTVAAQATSLTRVVPRAPIPTSRRRG